MIDFNISSIAPLCQEFGVELTDMIQERLNVYGNLLIEWNEKMNLTAITEPEAVLYKHFYDCILFLKHIELKKGAKIVVSNSDPKNSNTEDDFFDNIYSAHKIKRVEATRMINCNSESRGKIKELLISNF